MYVRMYARIYARMYVSMYVCMDASMYVCMYGWMHACMFVCFIVTITVCICCKSICTQVHLMTTLFFLAPHCTVLQLRQCCHRPCSPKIFRVPATSWGRSAETIQTYFADEIIPLHSSGVTTFAPTAARNQRQLVTSSPPWLSASPPEICDQMFGKQNRLF